VPSTTEPEYEHWSKDGGKTRAVIRWAEADEYGRMQVTVEVLKQLLEQAGYVVVPADSGPTVGDTI